ncbi:MAG TPA: sulfotransferase [Bauldia sp.]|nr:sulfotransferase [Bauldia sp.]
MPFLGRPGGKEAMSEGPRRQSGKRKLQPTGNPDRPKVFCIGFHKTGTTSLKEALKILNYRVTGPFGLTDRNIAANVEAKARELVPQFDAFQDNPWPLLYEFLDKEYPGSKFILTVRPTDKWIASVTDHFGTGQPPMREWIYGPGRGNPVGNEAVYVARYERHNREVLEYFKGRERDFLVFDLFAGDGWQKLCAFLDHPIPRDPFPWQNSKRKRERQVAKFGSIKAARRARRRRMREEAAAAAQQQAGASEQ